MIITHPGKLGDFIYTLPIASWIWKKTGQLITFVLPATFPPLVSLQSLLLSFPFTVKVLYITDWHIDNYNCGGQPYKIKLSKSIAKDEMVINFGLRGYPNKFITEFIAEEYGFHYDKDFLVNVSGVEDNHSNTDFVTENLPIPARTENEIIKLDLSKDILQNFRTALGCEQVHCLYSGFAALMYFSGKKFKLYREANRPSNDIFFPDRSRYELINC
jgi:hypothetical protein